MSNVTRDFKPATWGLLFNMLSISLSNTWISEQHAVFTWSWKTLPHQSMAFFKPLLEPWLYSSSLLIDPLGPPVFVFTSYVPASCHLQIKEEEENAYQILKNKNKNHHKVQLFAKNYKHLHHPNQRQNNSNNYQRPWEINWNKHVCLQNMTNEKESHEIQFFAENHKHLHHPN